MTTRSLRDVAADADADRFVTRDEELAVVRDVLDPDTPSRVLFVHGPGGIGKSATLRATGRLATSAGFTVVPIDARLFLDEIDGGIQRVLAVPLADTVLLFDEVDLLGSRLTTVRDRLIDALPDSARIVFAGRTGPDPSWRSHGLDALVVDLPLRPLTDAEAAQLLSGRGVDEAAQREIIAWALGSPLALTVASSTPAGPTARPVSEELEARLTSWLAGHAILDVPPEVLEVAAIAPVVDGRLLAAALPGRSTRQAMNQLAALPVVERVGDRVVLHAVLAAAITSRLEHTAPERSRLVTRRIVEHLAARARLGDIGALIELSQFISDPMLRQAVSNRPSPSMFTDRPRPDELASFARAQTFDQGADWDEVTRFAEHGRDYSLVTRRTDGSPVMFAAFINAAEIPDLGPVTTSLRVATQRTEVDPTRSFVGIVLFAESSEHDRAEAARLGTGALMHLHGIADMQAVLIHYPVPDRRPHDALSAIAEDLDGDLARQVAFSDFRPGGAVGFVEAIVLGELGFDAPETTTLALLADDDDPDRIARLREIVDVTFGDTPDEQRLRRAIELTHLGNRRTEQECLAELNVSRRTWYRLLRQSRERVLSAERPS